jgi:cytochrome P450
MSAMTADGPVLAGALRTDARGRETRKAKRDRLFPDFPASMFHEPVTRVNAWWGRFVLINDPAGVKRVLVDNVANYPKTEMERRFFTALFGAGLLGTDGEVWRRHRRIMAPAFDPRSVAGYGPAISQACEDFLRQWDNLADGAEVEIGQAMSLLTLRIIAVTMFSRDVDEAVDVVSRAMSAGFDAQNFSLLDILPIIAPIRMRRREAIMAEKFKPLDAAIARMMDARERDPRGQAADLLGRMMTAHDETGDLAMTAREIRDQVITIFIAGHETTAQAMTFAWYLLSQHPAEEARLHAELDAVLGGRTAGQADLPNLVYTRRVAEETMRLYPSAPGLSSRVCKQDDEVCGVKIKAGTQVAVSPWVLHRHRQLWDDPERFDPDRFDKARSEDRPRFAYLPFGAGPRVCIGQVLAMNEAILILANLAQKWRMRLAPGQEVAVDHNVTLRPRHGVRMFLERRRP